MVKEDGHGMKSFKYFKVPTNLDSQANQKGSVHKYSIYLQSRDSNWLQRNAKQIDDEPPEPLEEDIRD